MKVICSWCMKDMGIKEPLEDCSTSHGICGVCADKEREDLRACKEGVREHYARKAA